MDGITEKEFGNNCHYVESNRAKFIYWFKNGTQVSLRATLLSLKHGLTNVQVVQNGKLSAMFDRDDKINLLIFETADHMQYLPRSTLEGLFHVRSPHQNMSPKMSKKNPPNQRNPRMQNAEPTMLFSELPEAPVSTWGVTNPVLQFLEVRTASAGAAMDLAADPSAGWRDSFEHAGVVRSLPRQPGQYPFSGYEQPGGQS